jgi:hypothetical protein
MKRYEFIISGLKSRGVNFNTSFKKIYYINLWLIPLAVTTLIESVESDQYNNMLQTNILKYNETKAQFSGTNIFHIVILSVFVLVILIANILII